MKKVVKLVLVLVCMMTFMCACGSDKEETGAEKGNSDVSDSSVDNKADANEEYFEWEGNRIIGFTEKGLKQKNIVIPARCESISDVRFCNTKVEHVTFEDDDDIDLGSAFIGTETLISIELPANLTKVPNTCFQMCKSLKFISIPAAVTTIESYAFSACKALENVTFEGEEIAVIPENCFEYCDALKSIDIPESVTTIEPYAFTDCKTLENVTLNTGLKTIGKLAFNNTALKELHLPEGIQFETMDANAFGMNTYSMVVYIAKDSWCDLNQDAWNIGFAEIKYE